MKGYKIYVAAPWPEKLLARMVAERLTFAGHHVKSRWLWVNDGADPVVEAFNDLDDVAESDVLLLLNTQPRGEETSGKAVEFGYALALGLQLIVVGKASNIFHELPEVIRVDSLDEALDVLRVAQPDIVH